MKLIINVDGMHCQNCANRIQKVLSAYDENVCVDLDKKEVVITTDEEKDKIKESIEDLGFTVTDMRIDK